MLNWLEELILPSFVFKCLNSLIYFRFFVSFDLFLSVSCYSGIFLGLPLDYLNIRDNWWYIYRIFAVEWNILWYSESYPAVEVFRWGSWDYPKLVLREELSQESFKKDTDLMPEEMPLFKMFFVGIGSWAIAGATFSLLIVARIPNRVLLVAGITSDFSLFLE